MSSRQCGLPVDERGDLGFHGHGGPGDERLLGGNNDVASSDRQQQADLKVTVR